MKKWCLIILTLNISLMNAQHNNSVVQDKFLWAATVMNKTFPERIEACLAGGYNQMSAFPLDIKNWEDQGNTIEELNAMLKESNIRITILDPFTKWLPNWAPPEGASAEDIAFADYSEDDFFRMARALGVNRINLVESYTPKTDIKTLTENFARICDRAATLGISVGTEFMPFAPTNNNLTTAWEFVSKANKENGGLVFDTWHFYRSESDIEILKKIPTNKIVALQLADADLEIRGDNLFEDLMRYRKAPTEGEFPLSEIMDILLRDENILEIGVEIFADEYNDYDAKTGGEKSAKGIDNLFQINNYTLKNQDILTAHRNFCRSIWRGDKEHTSKALTADFIGVSLKGMKVDREKYLEVHFKKEFTRFEAIVEDVISQKDIAVLSGKMVTDDAEADMPGVKRFVAVYKKDKKNDWKLSFWQDTAIEK